MVCQGLQHRFEQLPAARDGFYIHTFTRCMRAAYIWSEGDHVQMRMAGGEQAALKSGMDYLQRRGLSELCGVYLLAQIKQR